MKRKIILLFTINIVLLLLLTYINGYRLTRNSIYKRFLSHYESESYEELLREKEFSVVKYDDYIVSIFFEPNYLLQRLENWQYITQPIVATDRYLTFDFVPNSEKNFDHYQLSSGILIHSNIGPLDIKLGSLSDQSKLVDIQYTIETINDNLHYYKFKEPLDSDEIDYRYVFIQNGERIYNPSINDIKLDNFIYRGTNYGSIQTIDILQEVPSGFVDYSVPINEIEPVLNFNYHHETSDAWYKSLFWGEEEIDYGMMDILLFKYKDDYYYDTNISKDTDALNPSLLDKEALLHNLEILENNLKQEIGE